MKKFFSILTLALLISIEAFSQMEVSKVKSFDDPWKFGIGVGATYDYLNPSQYTQGGVGMKFGICGEKHLVYMIYFRPSMNLWKRDFSMESATREGKMNGYFLDFEASIEFKFGDERLGKGFLLSLTPFVSYGLWGNTTYTNLDVNSADYGKETSYNTFEDDGFTKEDIGYKLGLGYDFNHKWEFNLNYYFGFNYIKNNNNYRWRGVSAGLTYFLK
ncbi:MAG: outer membrane beta-barrel protein [Bacteroidales bacterium]|nr:outer membrane beta-barrel protein [Candidatus Scybalousia scybalohippi]